MGSLGSTHQLTTLATFPTAPTTTVLVNTRTMTKLLFCLLVAVAAGQQWEDYETDSADYNSPRDYPDYRSADFSESSEDLDSGLWREEAVFLTPQDRETEASMVMEGVTPARGDVLAGDNRSQVGGGRDPRRSSRRRDELQPLWPRRKGEEGKVEGLGSLWES